jgi:hypothetical protein
MKQEKKVINKVLIPVDMVAGKSVSTLERWGIAALGAGAATALMATVVD